MKKSQRIQLSAQYEVSALGDRYGLSPGRLTEVTLRRIHVDPAVANQLAGTVSFYLPLADAKKMELGVRFTLTLEEQK
jgi:hypothetical protein